MTKHQQATPPDFVEDVREFQDKFGLSYDGKPRGLPQDVARFRVKFMEEELREYATADFSLQYVLGNKRPNNSQVVEHLCDQLDALVDLAYVVLGTAVLQFPPGVFEEAWRRVHAANMQKVRVDVVEQSKRRSPHDVVKPPGWIPPRHVDLVMDHAYEDVKMTGVERTPPKTTGVDRTPKVS